MAVDRPSARAGSAPGPKASSLGTSLLLLILACVAPAVAVVGLLSSEVWRLSQKTLHEETITLARTVIASVDRDLAEVESGLRVLATSPELASGDLEAFHRRASLAVASQIVYNYILTEPGGRMVLNTLVPWGKPLPASGTPAALEEVFRTGKPVLTDWFIGPVTGKPALAMGVPVYRAGRVVYSLNIGLTPSKIGELLARTRLPGEWVASVLDGRGTILARTRDGARYEGRSAVAAVREAMTRAGEGSLEAVTVDGQPVVTAFSRSARWGWSAAVGAPKAVLEAALSRLVGWTAFGIVLAVGLGTLVAARLGRKVAGSIRGLNDAALSLGTGRPFRLPAVQWREAEAVGRALGQAAALLEREHHRATHDPLTGLANRALYDELLRHELAQADRDQGRIALVALDLDGFKAVNDTYGHGAGDEVLKAAADRIQTCLRDSDVASRLGGDEFTVLLPGCDRPTAARVAGRLVERLSEPYPGSVGQAVSSSAGVAAFPEAGASAQALAAAADRALYRAKEGGKHRVATEPPGF